MPSIFDKKDAFYSFDSKDHFEEMKLNLKKSPAYEDAFVLIDEKEKIIYFRMELLEIEIVFPEFSDMLLRQYKSLNEENVIDYIRFDINFTILKELSKRQAELIKKADDFFQSGKIKDHHDKVGLRKKSSLPKQPLDAFLQLVKDHPMVIVGELHHHLAPKKIIFDNMQKLKEAGVDCIFMEHLFDTYADQLNKYILSDMKEMPSRLQTFLQYLDRMQGLLSAFPYNFTGLVIQAKKCKMKIVPIDTDLAYSCLRSYGSTRKRCIMMNYIAYQKIEEFYKKSKYRKAVIFTGSAHTNGHYIKSEKTYGIGCPGLKQLTGGTIVLVEDSEEKDSVSFGDCVPHSDRSWPSPDYVIRMTPDFSKEAKEMVISVTDSDSEIQTPKSFMSKEEKELLVIKEIGENLKILSQKSNI